MGSPFPKTIVFNVFCVVSLASTILLFKKVGKPYHRGFFCDDESISKPVKDSTLPGAIAGVVGIFVPIFAILIIELPRFREMKKDEKKPFYQSHWFRWLCGVYAGFVVGAGVNVVFTDVGKYAAGRLRPNFFAVCNPDFSKLNCTTGFHKNFITNYECTGNELLVKDARLSFPSGHSSFSAYTMIFLALYVDLRMTYCANLRLFKPMVQFVLVLLVFLCGLSRIRDNKHHWTDVISGHAIGVFFAFFFVLRVLELHLVNLSVKESRTDDTNIEQSDDVERGGTS